MQDTTSGAHALTIIGTSIRQDAHGRYCLNDLHRAAGGSEKDKPANFLRADGVAAFIAELDRTDAQNRASVSSTKGGPNQGTYAAELVVYRYAAWISAAFEVQVYSVFRDWARGSVERERQRIAADQERHAARLECPGMTQALRDMRAAQDKPTAPHHYSNEMDMINRLVLGMTAKQYRAAHGIDPDRPLRDAIAEMPAHIAAIRDLQRTNQALIEIGMDFAARKERLDALARRKHWAAMEAEILRLEG